MSDAVSEVTTRAKAVWASGDWDAVSTLIAAVGPKLLARLGDLRDRDLLDVGTGSGGTVAIPAAQRGARVVGCDLTDRWFEAGRRRAAEAAVQVGWGEANVEALPFPMRSFDVVTSTFGHMFAPRHAVAASEMSRVLRPGGTLATATWMPVGYGGAMFALIGEFMPKPPDFVQPPPLWGVEEHVEAMFEPHGLHLSFEHDTVVFRPSTPDAFVDFFETNFGPMVTTRAVLGEDGWSAFHERFRALVAEHVVERDGAYELTQHYLVTIGRKE